MKLKTWATKIWSDYFDVLVQERRNSSALAMALRLSCTNPSIWVPVSKSKHLSRDLVVKV